MRSPARLTIATLILLSAACTDNPLDPRSAPGPYIPDLDIFATYAPDSLSADITITPTGGTFVLGKHAVYFPAYSICRPNSTYGPTEWDQPCVVTDEDVNFHVEVRKDSTGRSWLDFTPAARFVPSDDPNQWVMVYMTVSQAEWDALGSAPPILWSNTIGEPGIDEATSDSTLRSYYIPGSNVVYRRIKHFSGYNVGVGFSDEGVTTSDGGEATEPVTESIF